MTHDNQNSARTPVRKPFDNREKDPRPCVECGKDERDHFMGTGWSRWCDEAKTQPFFNGRGRSGRYG